MRDRFVAKFLSEEAFMRSKRLGRLIRASIFSLSVFMVASPVASSPPEMMKLYQVKSGDLSLNKAFLTANIDFGKIIKVPVAMYIIEHPRGLVLYDTGNADDISDGKCEAYWGAALCSGLQPSQTRDDVIDRWLSKFGYSVDQVTHVIYSHFHLDHAGNVEMFPDAKHVVQKEELKTAWWPEKWQASAFVMKDYDETREFDFMQLRGDFDLFGDGSIVILDTKGHTQGHQSLLVRLPKTGSLILAGDAVYTPENENGAMPGITWNVFESMESINRLKRIRDAEGGDLWFSHNMEQYDTHNHDQPYE